MLKKSLVILTIFAIIALSSTFVFASNMTQGAGNVLNNVGNGMQNMVNGTRNTMQNVGNGVSNMMRNVGNGIGNVVNNVENGMSEENNQTDMTNGTTTDGYNATRTGAAGTTNAGNNAVVWIILAIAAVAIIGLVWYYAAQTNNVDNERR